MYLKTVMRKLSLIPPVKSKLNLNDEESYDSVLMKRKNRIMFNYLYLHSIKYQEYQALHLAILFNLSLNHDTSEQKESNKQNTITSFE